MDNPTYLPIKKDIVLSGYVDNSCQLPSSFSPVREKEPRNKVISGSKYKIRLSMEPVIAEYPLTAFCELTSSKLMLNTENKIRKE
ncbi:hypothetical protein D3C77_422390 [compost metagenome]